MEFYEVLRTRRSVRSYRLDPVPQDALDRVLEVARISLSGSNRQPWRFILVTDPGLRGELAAVCGNQEFVGEVPSVVVACSYDIRYTRGGSWGR
jgi:nitroreductase